MGPLLTAHSPQGWHFVLVGNAADFEKAEWAECHCDVAMGPSPAQKHHLHHDSNLEAQQVAEGLQGEQQDLGPANHNQRNQSC